MHTHQPSPQRVEFEVNFPARKTELHPLKCICSSQKMSKKWGEEKYGQETC